MNGLEYLKQLLAQKQRQLAAKQSQKNQYLQTASEIGKLYDSLSTDKTALKTYRNSLRTFANEKIDTFSGKLHNEKYKAEMDTLVSDYDTMISNVDANMDLLNTERSRYESLAYECGGAIGYLQSAINTLVRQIQNWVN